MRIAPIWRLSLMLAGSGAAALIYQVVWFALLGIVLGASAVSLGVLLATFMGGLCLGGYLLPRIVSPRRSVLAVLAVIEFGIAAIGIGVLLGLPAIANVYGAWAGPGFAGLALRAAVASLCLLAPTVLMGATLPAAARAVAQTPQGLGAMGFLYGANIAGGVIGSFAAGFYLLRLYNVTVATGVAVAVNLLVAGLALAASKRAPFARCVSSSGAEQQAFNAARTGRSSESKRGADRSWPVYLVAALSGCTALAAEVVWTRHLTLLLGATVYAFAVILALFLLGLALGSGLAARLARRLTPAAALAACQFALPVAIAWAAYSMAHLLPNWPSNPVPGTAPVAWLPLDLLRVGLTVLPAAVLWGASFPLAISALGGSRRDPATDVGGVYVANTIGAVIGSLVTSFVLIVRLGSHQTEQLMALVAAGAGLIALTAAETGARRRTVAIVVVGIALAVPSVLTLPGLPADVIAYGRFAAIRAGETNVIYTGEGMTASIAVSADAEGVLSYHSAGKIQASAHPPDLRLQRMLGHMTTLAAADPRDFLVIGLGAGVTAGAVALDPAVESVTIAEIEPLVPRVAAQYFDDVNFDVMDAPKVSIRLDDGRHVLATSNELFDGITSDPLDPWVKGAATLYTEEFWQLVRLHLAPGGVVTVFVQLYQSTDAAVKSEVATFFEVFPAGGVFANTVEGRGYDLVLLARADGSPIDIDAIHSRLGSQRYAPVARSLLEVGFVSAADLFGTFVGGRKDFETWLEGAQINRDRNLRLQYLAGEGFALYRAEEIFASMVTHRPQFPEALFTGSPLRLEELRQRMRALPPGP
jgi:spermidine synthase